LLHPAVARAACRCASAAAACGRPAGQPAGWRAGGLAGWAGRHGSPLALSRQHFQRPQSQAPHFRALRPRPIITATATATAMSRRRRRRRRLRCGRARRRRRCDERHHAHACGAEEQRQRSRLLLLPPSAIAATVITHATAALDQWQRSSRASRCLPQWRPRLGKHRQPDKLAQPRAPR
jgi:hypothetical protein